MRVISCGTDGSACTVRADIGQRPISDDTGRGAARVPDGEAAVRRGDRAWNVFKGVCGHCHVPENQHGDPGAIGFATLIEYAREYAS